MSAPARGTGQNHAHCNHNHGAEHQLRTLNQNQNNRGSASLAEFQQAARETSQFRGQEAPRSTQAQARSQNSAGQTKRAPRQAAHPERSSFQGTSSAGTSQASPPSQTQSQQAGGRIFQSHANLAPRAATPQAHGQAAQTKTAAPPARNSASQQVAQNTGGKAGLPATPTAGTVANPATGMAKPIMTPGNPSQGTAAGKALGFSQSGPSAPTGTALPGKAPTMMAAKGTAQGLPGVATATQTLGKPGALQTGRAHPLAGSPSFQGILSAKPAGHLVFGKVLGPGMFGLSTPVKGRALGLATRQHALPARTIPAGLAAPVMGSLAALRSPGLMQRMEKSVLQFSNILFGNYLKGLHQSKMTPHEMMLQQLALMMAAEEKRKKESKKTEKDKSEPAVEAKPEIQMTEELIGEEEDSKSEPEMISFLNLEE